MAIEAETLPRTVLHTHNVPSPAEAVDRLLASGIVTRQGRDPACRGLGGAAVEPAPGRETPSSLSSNPGSAFVTRSAPGVGRNDGEAIELVVPVGSVEMQSLSHTGTSR